MSGNLRNVVLDIISLRGHRSSRQLHTSIWPITEVRQVIAIWGPSVEWGAEILSQGVGVYWQRVLVEKMRPSRRSLKNCEISESRRKSKAWENAECSSNRKTRRKCRDGNWPRREFWGKEEKWILLFCFDCQASNSLCASPSLWVVLVWNSACFLWWNQRIPVHPLPAPGRHRSRPGLWGHPLKWLNNF